MKRTILKIATLALSLSLIGACVDMDMSDGEIDNNPPLANVDELLDGAPKADEIEPIYKADETLPAKHDSLREFMSPVQSQGRRGVCSIFSTVAFMEHLYLVEGSVKNPDFSEQYLQWAAKFQVNSFPNSSGSNAHVNLRAITEYGIPAEEAWPYETAQWGLSDDPECDGEDEQPTRCYTNGAPPEFAMQADKYSLPRGRFLSPRDIKAHINATGTGVVAGMTFFYQSWNHRLSKIPVNSDMFAKGIVRFPNNKDEELSLEDRAGHSILIFGWDDELEVPTVDENGEPVVDEDGEPVMEKGFYIFKNSWGTGGFGTEHPLGDGYGYISQRYVNGWASVRIAGIPEDGDFVVHTEICDDGEDNDENGVSDCDDSACADSPLCIPEEDPELSFNNDNSLSIPDNDPVGVSSIIEVADEATIQGLVVAVDISHSFRGDLQVSLHRGDEAVTLHNREGFGANDLVQEYEVSDFNGADLRGEWRLHIVDRAAIDTGELNNWTLTATVEP